MRHERRHILLPFALAVAALCGVRGHAQSSANAAVSDPRALQLIRSAMQSELYAADHDHNNWTYHDTDKTEERNAVYLVVGSPEGELRRMIEINGRPVTPAEAQKETARLRNYINDPDAQAKARKNGQHDDKQARTMLDSLPATYIWTIREEGPELVTLEFRPNPNFNPPSMESRVMANMAGELVIAKADNRIRTLRGALTQEVKFGYGLFGKLEKGGTFDVERREIAPHIWQITESRVHISGHALMFKTIGQQEDEIKTDWKLSKAPNLKAAAAELGVN